MLSPIPEEWAVPALFRERMGASAGRQRAMGADGHLLLVLHEMPSSVEATRRKARLFWRAPQGRWESLQSGSISIDPLRGHVAAYTAAIEVLEDRVEAADTAHDYFEVLRQASPLLRSTRNMAKALQYARELADKDRELIAIRDSALDAERSIELVYQLAGQGLEFLSARANEEQARSSEYLGRANHRLNLLAAFTLPITALGSLFGINLVSGVETWNSPWAFWILGVLSTILGFVVHSKMPSPETSETRAT